MRFGGEIHRSTCRYKYQTRPRSLHPPISSFVGLCVDVASLRICCVSWVLQGFGVSRCGVDLGALSEENFGGENVSQVGGNWGSAVSIVSVGAQMISPSLALRGD